MRGTPQRQETMISIRTPGERVAKDHPLRRIKDLAEGALGRLSPTFEQMYSRMGRPSIPPEQLLKSSVLMALYSVRSERQFCEQLDYNLLYRWFLEMGMEEESFNHSTFSANRQRLLEHEVAKQFFTAVIGQAKKAGLLSAENFSVDGTLVEAWASLKSFRPKQEEKKDKRPPDDPGNPTVDFRGEKRSNQTHQSTTDPEAKLARQGKGKEAKLAFCANGLMENRHGLLLDIRVMQATGTAGRDAAVAMLHDAVPGQGRVTVGADKGYDTKDFVEDCRHLKVTPHVAQNLTERRGSAIDGRTTSSSGYAVSQRKRKLVEEVWGWMKTVGGLRKTRFRGIQHKQLAAYFVGAAYNLLRMTKLMPA